MDLQGENWGDPYRGIPFFFCLLNWRNNFEPLGKFTSLNVYKISY
jgi:hypothetical protein